MGKKDEAPEAEKRVPDLKPGQIKVDGKIITSPLN